jgi:hypothetical protein
VSEVIIRGVEFGGKKMRNGGLVLGNENGNGNGIGTGNGKVSGKTD